ncbi:acetyl esterase/lipase [Umezawaea tangerina]|uniref:Acetyl esterase/lipase n=1 Tax=Umezawaea tangerina TaxID=84725 RepID=A0A2T0TFQ7_9PSEU|nr:alpha/beta hydrolase fold domain-containing protein [Umezawaea tangerina]PRY44479.1 acetyl esterase/lipase [Umezawaea tangerina]
MSAFHPELALARFLPKFSMGPRATRLAQRVKPRTPATPDDMLIEDVVAPGVSVRVYRPKALEGTAPALLWLHGGGYLMGSPEQDEPSSIGFARDLGITVVAARYRFAPTHPAPAAVEDAYAALLWLVANADARGVDPSRIALGGASAGGGLAAGLALYAHDHDDVCPAFQLLVYPMLDDRTVLRTDHDTRHVRLWTPKSNRYAWTSYLATTPGSPTTSPLRRPRPPRRPHRPPPDLDRRRHPRPLPRRRPHLRLPPPVRRRPLRGRHRAGGVPRVRRDVPRDAGRAGVLGGAGDGTAQGVVLR